MRLGFTLSLAIHVALILWAVLHLERTKLDDVPETVAISVAVVTPSDITRMKQGDETTKNLESKAAETPSEDNSQKEAPKPKAAAPAPPPPPPAEEPPPPEPAKAEPPKPDPIQEKLAALPPEKAPEPPPVPPTPTPDDQAALAAKLEEERKAEAKRKADAEAKAKAEAEKKRKEAEAKKKAEELRKKKLAEAAAKAKAEANKFDPNKLADLINKTDDGPQKALIDKSNKPTGAKPTGDSKTATNTGPSAGTRDGHDSVLSAREADMLTSLINQQLKRCWNLPAGGGGSETPIVRLAWHLNQDGTLNGEPLVLQPQSTPLFQVAAEAAVRAVKTCVPFQLPPEKYAAWREITEWVFDPSKMR